MSNRELAERFAAFRHISKVQKALARSAIDIVENDYDEYEIEALHDAQTRNAARDANYDYSDAESLVLVRLEATRVAKRFAFLNE